MYRMSKRCWIILLVTVVFILAACVPITPDAQTSPLEEPASQETPAPIDEATGVATEEATEEPTQEPAEDPASEITPEPAGESAGEEVDMGALVRQILAQQLQLNLDEIEIVSVEQVEWPDACLGVYTADMMCAQVITPGYRVILAVDGQQYEYHTNLDGNFVQLASAPEANIGDVLIEWQQTQDTCQAARFGTEGVEFGPCMGVRMGGMLVSSEREAELADFVATFAPFEAETPAGMVIFHGEGSTDATPAEQRLIAEWARQAALEASAGRSGAGWGLAFAWHREGGIAGFCDDLTVYVTGQLFAASCKGQTPETIAARRMSAEELEQVYAWVDEYAPFEYIHADDAIADAMEVRLVFSGAGSTPAGPEVQQEILDFAAALYTEVSE